MSAPSGIAAGFAIRVSGMSPGVRARGARPATSAIPVNSTSQRHRGDRSRPSGKKSGTRMATVTNEGISVRLLSQTNHAVGVPLAPGPTLKATASPATASAMPIAELQSNHPTTLRGWRLIRKAPTTPSDVTCAEKSRTASLGNAGISGRTTATTAMASNATMIAIQTSATHRPAPRLALVIARSPGARARGHPA